MGTFKELVGTPLIVSGGYLLTRLLISSSLGSRKVRGLLSLAVDSGIIVILAELKKISLKFREIPIRGLLFECVPEMTLRCANESQRVIS